MHYVQKIGGEKGGKCYLAVPSAWNTPPSTPNMHDLFPNFFQIFSQMSPSQRGLPQIGEIINLSCLRF